MKPNEGKIDRIIRVIIGIISIIIGLKLTPPISIILFIIAGIAILTGAIGFCGLYKILGINTCKVK